MRLHAREPGSPRRLLVTMPPRHGKSEMCSHWFPVWALALDPTTKIILTSYEAEFAKTWGRKARRSMEAAYPMIGSRIVDDSRAAHRWETTAGGGMVTAGVGGPITGRGGNIVICDDPVKNAEEANSQVIRQNIWDWWTTTFLTRLEPDRMGREAVVVLIMCLTGDTPVLLADGSETPLRDIRPGDEVATYENGGIGAATVKNWANQGPDRVFEIRTKSGRVVRANARHPFLVERAGGVEWRRTATLRKGDAILRVTGGNGLIPDPIVSIEDAGIEEVFDLQIDRTENFIANGLVSHNTRWHEDDLAGRIMQTEEFKFWRHLNLPALAEPEDELGRPEGEALWPARFSRTTLESKRAELGTRAFTALYQQRPSPLEGAAILRTWWQWYDDAPPLDEFDQIIQSWDPTFKDAGSSDFVAGGVIGRRFDAFYLLDCEHRRMNGPATLEAIAAMDQAWPRARYLLIEDSASGTMIGQMLSRERGHIIMVQTRGRSKEVRLHWGVNSVAAVIQRGQVFLPRGRSWAMKLVDEAANFPNGQHDDLIDMLVQGIQHLMPRVWVAQNVAASAARNAPPANPREAYFAHLRACVARKQEAYRKATSSKAQFPGM